MKRIGWFYLGGGLLIVGLCSGFYFWLFAPISRAGTPQLFTVQSAESITSIARRLEEGQLIRSAWGFKAYLKISGKVVVQPGTYEISTKDSLIKIANLIASGDTTNVTLTIPEGYTLAQIAEQVGQKNIADAAEFTRLVKDFPPDYEFLKVRPTGQTSLEGFLFSSKYTTDIKPKLGDKNLYEIITVASLIEREVKTTEDMVMVSGVIYNRLKIGMKLDIDATVRFIINNWKDPLTRDDLSVDSPYNTRRYAGLPPGPICNPGLAAIEAALQPADHDYYYYLTDYDGVTHYAKTLAEHNQNKLQYLL